MDNKIALEIIEEVLREIQEHVIVEINEKILSDDEYIINKINEFYPIIKSLTSKKGEHLNTPKNNLYLSVIAVVMSMSIKNIFLQKDTQEKFDKTIEFLLSRVDAYQKSQIAQFVQTEKWYKKINFKVAFPCFFIALFLAFIALFLQTDISFFAILFASIGVIVAKGSEYINKKEKNKILSKGLTNLSKKD